MIRRKRYIKNAIMRALSRASLDFFELQSKLVEKNIDVFGEYEMVVEDKNILIWDGVSETFLDAISDLVNAGKIELIPCSIERYKSHGCEFEDMPYEEHGADFDFDGYEELTFVPFKLKSCL